jgi:hypothetical protein
VALSQDAIKLEVPHMRENLPSGSPTSSRNTRSAVLANKLLPIKPTTEQPEPLRTQRKRVIVANNLQEEKNLLSLLNKGAALRTLDVGMSDFLSEPPTKATQHATFRTFL